MTNPFVASVLILDTHPAGNYMFKVNNKNTRTRCKICSKLTKTPERCEWHHSGVFIVNFEHISQPCYSVFIANFEQVNECRQGRCLFTYKMEVSPNVVGYLNLPLKVFTILLFLFICFWVITYCIQLVLSFIVFSRCK